MADGVKGDMPAHIHTYEGFLRVFRMGAIASFVVAAIVVIIIAS
jgi:hypothetical protein